MSDVMIDLEQSPENWPRVELGSICDVWGGFAAPKGEEPFKNGSVPFVRMQDLGRYHRTTNLIETKDQLNPDFVRKRGLRIVPKGSILIPRSGSVSLNHRAILGTDACIVSHICALTQTRGDINPQYLYWALCNFDMRNIMRKTTGLDAITFEDVKHVRIPIPPLDVQRNIAATLCRAERVQQIRQQANQLINKVIQSVFLKMFGDPTTNSMNWNSQPLSRIVEIKTGLPMTPKRRPRESSYPYLTVRNVHRGALNLTDLRQMEVTQDELEEWRLRSGDVLVVEGHANIKEIGRAALFNGCIRDCVHQNHLFRLRPMKELVDPFFLLSYLNSSTGKEYFRKVAKTTSGLNTVNSTNLRNMNVRCPPIELQKRFAASVQQAEAIKDRQNHSTQKLDELFHSLMHKAFRGELAVNKSKAIGEP